jgi:hypothetical protein
MELAGIKSEPVPLDNPVAWSARARAALTLDDAEIDVALRKAFEELRLNPNDPFDWRMLATLLATLFFARPAPSGRPTQWDGERYCELLEAVDRRQFANPGLSDKKACQLIAADRHSPAYFRKARAEGLRKALRSARSLENEFVRAIIERAMPEIKNMREAAGLEWSPSVRTACAAASAKQVASLIASWWRLRDKAT